MSTRIKFDLRGPSLVNNDLLQGLTIERGVQILDFGITNKTSTSSDPMVLLRALAMVGSGPGDYIARFPQLDDTYPPPNGGDPDFTFCTVTNQRITGLDRAKHILNAVIRYHSPIGPQSEGVVTYTVNDASQQAWVRTYVTADGSEVLSGWYEPDYAFNDHFDAPGGPDAPGFIPLASILSAPTQKLYSHRIIRAIGRTTRSNWNSVKGPFHAARGMINADTTGAWAPRGKWLYLGPSATYNNAGVIGTIEHVVMEAVGRWFPIQPFFNQHGEHPADSSTEVELTTADDSPGYPPPVGRQIRISGLTMSSIYYEANFASLFSGTVVTP